MQKVQMIITSINCLLYLEYPLTKYSSNVRNIFSQRPFAFNMNTGTGYRIVSAIFQEHEKCGLQEIEYIPNSNPWLCSRRLSPYGELFKVG